MNYKLYVSSLPFKLTQEEFEALFEGLGEVVSAQMIVDSKGKGKGFGFVEMANEEDALNAIEKLNGSECQGRAISVCEARTQKSSTDDDAK